MKDVSFGFHGVYCENSCRCATRYAPRKKRVAGKARGVEADSKEMAAVVLGEPDSDFTSHPNVRQSSNARSRQV